MTALRRSRARRYTLNETILTVGIDPDWFGTTGRAEKAAIGSAVIAVYAARTCSAVGALPAIVVRRMSRTWV